MKKQNAGTPGGTRRMFKKNIGSLGRLHVHKARLRQLGLRTVCENARCPNIGECFSLGHSTIIALGPGCTRRCSFCSVWKQGTNLAKPKDEVNRIITYVEKTSPSYLVVTSVTRDDLPDGGASFFQQLAVRLKSVAPHVGLEFLIPDLHGCEEFVILVANSPADVVGHNVETVPSLYPQVRPQASFERSLSVLRTIARVRGGAKTAVLTGLGETEDELEELFHVLAGAGVNMLAIGQYFQPSFENVPVRRYYSDAEFVHLAETAKKAGITHVFAGRYVRSSYMAHDFFRQTLRQEVS